MELKPSEELERALVLIDTPEKWIKYYPAVNLYGHVVSYQNPTAVRFCSVGALKRVGAGEEAYKMLSDKCSIETFGKWISTEFHITYFNDTSSHKQIMELWKAAIAELKSQGR